MSRTPMSRTPMKMQRRACLVLVVAWTLAGCATGENQRIVTLEDQLAQSREKAAALKKENRTIKEELDLFRKTQDIDRDQLLAARDAFREGFKKEVAEQVVAISVTARGLDLVIPAEKIFVSGSDALSPEGKALLDRVASLIDATLPRHYVYIEGHTDNQPLAIFEWKSDWDFSFARALSVLKYFTEVQKLDPLRFSAAGFGQYRPRATNETKEGRSLNRRVELIVSPQRIKSVGERPPGSSSDE